jgi:acetyl-CoA C-acetyltransferase
MTDLDTAEVSEILGGAGDQEWELFLGATFPALYAMMARKYMEEYQATEEMLASVAVKNHRHGSMNPLAQFQNEISIEDVLKSKMVADPLKILDCSPITDGAAALVLAPLENAKKYTDTPVEVVASAQASDTLTLHNRDSITGVKAANIAAQEAYKEAGVSPSDIKVAEVHDCFTIAEIMAIEDLGFFPKGKGGEASLNGETAIGGKVAINTSGGLKAAGHPVGATGVKQAVEITWQLQGKAGKRQVPGADLGLSHNVGGSGATAVVHIYRRVG